MYTAASQTVVDFEKGVQTNITCVTNGNPVPVLTIEESITSSTGGTQWTATKSSSTGKLSLNMTITTRKQFRCKADNAAVPERTVTLEAFFLSKPTIRLSDTDNTSTTEGVYHTLECNAKSNQNIQRKIRYKYWEESDEKTKFLKSTSGDFRAQLNFEKKLSVYCFAYIDDQRFDAIGVIELTSQKLELSKTPDEGQKDNLTTIGVLVLIFGGILILGGLMAYRQYKESTREQSAIPAEEHRLKESKD
ncbi:unnamed protein product [Oikopleura dioica]|nr:unnamed protein product [Oikopleura dioica]